MAIAVSISGGYWTGSSAIVDLLSEHQECSVVKGEFALFSFGQFFSEVYNPLINQSYDKDKVLQNLRRFNDFNKRDLYLIERIIKFFLKKIHIYPQYFFNNRGGVENNFSRGYYEACNKLTKIINLALKNYDTFDKSQFDYELKSLGRELYINNVTNLNEAIKIKCTIFDQLISPPYIKYCQDANLEIRYINVDRNWKDQYISLKNVYRNMIEINNSLGIRPWDEDMQNWLNLNSVEYFIKLRRMIDRAKKENDSDNTLWVDFDELVYNKKETALKIFNFLGVNSLKWDDGSHLNVELSRKNTKKWLKKEWDNPEFHKELDFIKKELGY